MQKVIIILLVLLFTTGCSLTRKKIGTGLNVQVEEDNEFLISKVREHNIANENFNISKAEIEIVSNNDKKSFLASVRFNKPDKYLVSIKSKAGIEVARIYITNDSILVNDRFNRIQYYGSPRVLYERYGISNDLFSLIFGDYNDSNCVINERKVCKNDRLEIICTDKNTEITYEIDCNRNKVIGTILANQMGRGELTFSFTDFMMIKNILLPQEIKVTGFPGVSLMKINIRKLDFPWEGNVEFIPGNRYEKIELL